MSENISTHDPCWSVKITLRRNLSPVDQPFEEVGRSIEDEVRVPDVRDPGARVVDTHVALALDIPGSVQIHVRSNRPVDDELKVRRRPAGPVRPAAEVPVREEGAGQGRVGVRRVLGSRRVPDGARNTDVPSRDDREECTGICERDRRVDDHVAVHEDHP